MADLKRFESCERLFNTKEAFNHSPESERLFDLAMNEAMRFHAANCPDYRAFLREKGVVDFNRQYSASEIPPLLVSIFKEFKLASVPQNKVKIELTSSGTGGRKSAIILDNCSYRRIMQIVENIFDSLKLVNHSQKVNYLCFTYDPKYAGSVGTAFSDKMLTGLTAHRSIFYAIRKKNEESEFEFDLDLTVKKLLSFAKQANPVRILGFPAYLWRVCDELEAMSKTLSLGEDSYIITGGGWKLHKDKEVSKEVFKSRAADILGIPKQNVRDLFGMVEHGIPYVDCEAGRLHVPIYAKAMAVDPETLKSLPNGQEGLLYLMSPYLTSYPSISLLTTDKAIIETNCPCGRGGATFRITGRAGLSKHKGCAITALDLLKQL